MERSQRTYRLSAGLIIILHFFGILGLFWPPMNQWLSSLTPFKSFLSLTPMNLLLTGALLIAFQRTWNQQRIVWLLGSALVGFGVEVAGVHTGLIFGEYAYGDVLGWKLWDIPLLIGLNWMVLTYVLGTIVCNINVSINTKAIIMATGLMVMDVLIEPVAIHWNFWRWEETVVPMQNYVAWWLIAWVLSIWWLKAYKKEENSLALPIFIAQIAFFAVNNILISTL